MSSILLRAVGASAFLLLSACSTTTTPSGPVGGAVTGTQDNHCGTKQQLTTQAACQKQADAGVPEASAPDAATGDGGTSEYGITMFNQSGADDECKYDVAWTSTPIRKDDNVTFTVTMKNRVGGAGTTGAEPDLDVFLDDTHPAPSVGAKTTDKGGGVYEIGPIRFDKAGRWTVRFHFFDACVDGVESPHGHAAFYVDVP